MAESSPLRADAERNRQRLLAAAREVFAQRGVGVTLDDIARHAGVGVGTAYRRFANKGELIDALLVERIDDLTAIATRQFEEEPDPWLSLRGYLEQALELLAADRGLKEVLYAPGSGAARVARARGTLAPAVARLVERAKRAGVVREDLAPTDIPLMSKMLMEVVEFGRDVQPDLWRRYLEILLAGIRPDGPPLPVKALALQRFQRAMIARDG